jgi:serine/threonine-protein kinase
MAEVFRAEAGDGRAAPLNVALKMMKKGMNLESFAEEADLMGLLSHPNLVNRLEVGQAFGRPYIAMEFLSHGDLARMVRGFSKLRRPFPVHIALFICIEVCKALAYFHQAKSRGGMALHLVHGDVNPSNVFFGSRGEVKLGDFGVAKSHRVAIGPPDGVAAGKWSYLSPEQIRGGQLGPASDVYAVGVMLHELLLGAPPTPIGEVPKSIVGRAQKLSLPDALDRQLAAVLRRSLAPEVDARYPTAGALAGELFAHALDSGQSLEPKDFLAWLESSQAELDSR